MKQRRFLSGPLHVSMPHWLGILCEIFYLHCHSPSAISVIAWLHPSFSGSDPSICLHSESFWDLWSR